MKIHEYNEMMRYLTRPKQKPMPMPEYINLMNRLYGNGGAVDPDKDPKYIDPKEMDAIKKNCKFRRWLRSRKSKLLKRL